MALKKTAPTKDLAEFDRTSWKENDTPQAGWGPFPYQFFDDLPRLTRGNVQAWLMMYLCRLTLGLEPSRREDGWPDWTPWCKWSDVAERVDSTIRTVQEEAHEAERRTGGGLIEVQERRGEVRFRLLWRTWGKLQSYADVPRPALVPDAKPKTLTALLDKPFTVKAGRKSRPIAIPGWEKEIAFQGGATDCAVSLFLESDTRLLVETAATASFSPSSEWKKSEVDTDNKEDTGKNRHHSAESLKNQHGVKKDPGVKKQPALFVPKPLVHACAAFGLVDDTGILQLVADCQSYAAECSIEEIALEVKRVGESASPKQKNVAALIRSEVPKYFNSTAYREGIKPGVRKPVESAMSERDRKVFATMKMLKGDYSGIK